LGRTRLSVPEKVGQEMHLDNSVNHHYLESNIDG